MAYNVIKNKNNGLIMFFHNSAVGYLLIKIVQYPISIILVVLWSVLSSLGLPSGLHIAKWARIVRNRNMNIIPRNMHRSGLYY